MRSVTAETRERGSVTAEFAAVIPAVILVLIFCLSGIALAGQQLRLQDAAADAARTVARGDGAASALGDARRSVPGVSLATSADGDLECTTLAVTADGLPGTLLRLHLSARGCALADGR
jgi:Flp pilus assembly protein TadG